MRTRSDMLTLTPGPQHHFHTQSWLLTASNPFTCKWPHFSPMDEGGEDSPNVHSTVLNTSITNIHNLYQFVQITLSSSISG